ncbi:MAG TPA: hypothetical protein VF815_13760 [Myxococcaceae bacterium]|jgi:hypothetical protein
MLRQLGYRHLQNTQGEPAYNCFLQLLPLLSDPEADVDQQTVYVDLAQAAFVASYPDLVFYWAGLAHLGMEQLGDSIARLRTLSLLAVSMEALELPEAPAARRMAWDHARSIGHESARLHADALAATVPDFDPHTPLTEAERAHLRQRLIQAHENHQRSLVGRGIDPEKPFPEKARAPAGDT